MAVKKILVVLTSRDKMNNGEPTGWYLVSILTQLPCPAPQLPS